MTSFFELLAVSLFLWLALSNSGMKKRLKSLEDDQRKNRERLELLEHWKNGAGAVASDGVESPVETSVTEVKTSQGEDTALVDDTKPENVGPAETEKTSSVTSGPPRAFVFTGTLFQQLGQWLRQNWTIALAALSLALGGVFMVQYGVENGLLTPFWRVAGALLLGALLVCAGEVIRRRYGDEKSDATRYLPSAFAGAGLITLFSAVLAARLLYGLVSAETTLAGLVVVSILAVALGWLYGSVLSAVGIIGATAAPFLVGGESESSWLFSYYFALISIIGLAVDSVKRWAWVSAVVLIVTAFAATMLYAATGGLIHYAAYLALSWLAASIIPVQNFVPSHKGQTVLATLSGSRPRADFPTRVVAAMTLFVSVAFVILSIDAQTVTEANIAVVSIALILGATLIWMHRAEALADIPIVPAAAFLAVPVVQAFEPGPLFSPFTGMSLSQAEPVSHTAASTFVTYVLILSVVASLMAFWRMYRVADNARAQLGFALGAAVFAPTMAFILQFLWSPADVFGDRVWSLYILAISAVMAFLTDRVLRDDRRSGRQLHAALFSIAALSMLALALFVLLTQTALTLALGVIVVLTIWLDRRFDLALIGIFTKLALAIIAFRLVANPGFFWAMRENTSWLAFLEAYLGTLILLYAG
ncbi:DUF2339 domain-containing protein [Martelella mediterranea]|uniref:Putative membrane protein DUF2339 n=1 Tax=Martelella mediterranea TaxID=293089 RepID=A0A4R3NR80_9HYPH|nr:putative membrane protein DUF2339 [Martelella mediterranea]